MNRGKNKGNEYATSKQVGAPPLVPELSRHFTAIFDNHRQSRVYVQLRKFAPACVSRPPRMLEKSRKQTNK